MGIFDRRSVGLLVPLFTLRSSAGWGTGELPDFVRMAAWARRAGATWLLTLPLLEPSPGQESPYSSASFFALDPIAIAVHSIPEFLELGGVESLDAEERLTLTAVRGAPRVDHAGVRWLKERVLRRCHARFRTHGASARKADFASFRSEHAAWLEDYARFRVLKAIHPESWRAWPEGLRERDPGELAALDRAHADELAFRTYLQWLAFRQLEATRAAMHEVGVSLVGDEPFLVADDSADVWAHRELFRFDATVGAPPDAFSAEGQEWGLPPYAWDAHAAARYALFRARGAHAAKLLDGVRIDHVVGLYRTYVRPLDKSPAHFVPADPAAQLAQGEAVLEALQSGGLTVLAEDLGVIPTFVRKSLQRLRIPGYCVLRWEQDQGRFRDPATWPELSLATTGTHDTESNSVWWEGLSEWERAAFLAMPAMAPLREAPPSTADERVWHAMLEAVVASQSVACVIPILDLLALRERFNTPNTVGPLNWSLRLPWTLEALDEDPIVVARAETLRRMARAAGRDA